MSGASGAGAPPPAGVVCNSALSFVAAAQPMQPVENDNVQGNEGNFQETSGEQSTQADRMVPVGLKSLCEACSELYPDQPNPLQVTTRLKYWLGGEDPLDYISMYWNPGKPEEHIPPHWHYISFGLTDLHGDGRVHPLPTPGGDSGYGFELTFRLACEDAESQSSPPLWPAALCQALARYVFTTGNKLMAGDHISWHRALDGGRRGRVRHLLAAPEPALQPRRAPHGAAHFLQIVGCTGRELKAAQRGSGFEVLKLMREDPTCGGPLLVTRARRRRSARGAALRAAPAPAPAPPALAGVSCVVRWVPVQLTTQKTESPPSPSPLSHGVQQQIKDTLQRGLTAMSTDSLTAKGLPGQTVGHMSTDSFEMSSMEKALPQITDTVSSWRDEDSVQFFDAVHIFMNAEGASLLPLAIDGRIKHGAHFTWREAGCAVTMLPPSVSGAFATARRPYAARGDWLQVVISKEVADELSAQVASFSALCQSDSESDTERPRTAPPALPLVVTARGLALTVL